MKKFLTLIFLSSLMAFAMAQQTKILTAERHNEYGLVYTLPSTAFKVEIVAVKETRLAGPYSKYAKIFTKDSQVIQKNSVEWSIESVKVTPYGIPDSDNRYLMQLKAGATTFIGVSDDGMLLSINRDPELKETEPTDIVQLEGVRTTGKEYLEFVNEDFIAAQSSYKQAQLLAEEIMEIRDARTSLTRGTAETMPTDGRQLEIMLASLENQEKALLNAFTGSTWKERVVRTFSFIPDMEGETVICKLNKTEGLVEADASSGQPVFASLSAIVEASLPLDSKGEEKKLPKDAVIYCIPGVADLTISTNNQVFSKDSYEMSQFGMLFGLNPSIFTDKKEPSYAIFDPATGALKELGSVKDSER